MASWSAEIRRREAEARRQERDARKRHNELERRIKERAKLSELEQARLEIDAYQSELETLLSSHKEQSSPVEWQRLAAALPPHSPTRPGSREFLSQLETSIARTLDRPAGIQAEHAHLADERQYQEEFRVYKTELKECYRLRDLAASVLQGDAAAYTLALSEFSLLNDLSHLGSSIQYLIHSAKLVECILLTNGKDIIPAQLKTLSSTGKLSVKPMPKARFNEVYQDYVCSCVLRVGREIFAVLPIDTLIVTVNIRGVDSKTGKKTDLPVLSVILVRETLAQLNFEQLDPSDSMENFVHRGDVLSVRRGGDFIPITAIVPADLISANQNSASLPDMLQRARQLRAQLCGISRRVALPRTSE